MKMILRRYVKGDKNDFYVQGNNADPNLTQLYPCHRLDVNGLEEFKLNDRDLENANIFRLWDGKNLYDTRDDLFSDTFPLKIYQWHIKHYFHAIFERYKATLGPTEQSSDEIYSDNWLVENYNKSLTLMERPLQGRDDDTCEVCAIIAAAIEINGKIKDPLNGCWKNGGYSAEIMFASQGIVCTQIERNQISVYAKRQEKVYLLVHLKNLSVIHCSFAIIEGDLISFYNSWMKDPIILKLAGLEQFTIKDSGGFGTLFTPVKWFILRAFN